MATVMDSYTEINYSGSTNFLYDIGGNEIREAGQSFTGNGDFIDYVDLYLQNNGSAVGSMQCYIYEHSGTYGTSSIPTGNPLSTSDIVDISTISSSIGLVRFQFPSTFQAINGTKYCLVWKVTGTTGGTSSTKNILYGRDTTSPTHGGNRFYYTRFDSTWNPVSSDDVIFYVYGGVEAITSKTITGVFSMTGVQSITL